MTHMISSGLFSSFLSESIVTVPRYIHNIPNVYNYDNSCIKRDSCRKIRKIACIKILNYMGDSAFVY